MFLVCGEALFDVFSAPAAPDGSVPMQAVIGGSPLNVAIGLARLGQRAGFFAGVSTDALGAILASHVEREGVESRFLIRKPNATTLSLVSLSAQGVPHYSFYGHAAADISLTPEDLPALDADVVGLHFGSYTIAADPAASTLAALARREAHRLVTLDPNIRPTVEPDMAIWRRRVEALAAAAAVIKASDEDIAHLYPGAEITDVVRRWQGLGPALVVVTRGAQGATGHHAAGELSVTPPEVTVVDTVGAGDTFQAALIAGLLDRGIRNRAGVAALGQDALRQILDRAALAASITCGRRGADLPRLADLPPL